MEMGDKTQLTSFTLTVRYRNKKKVFLGISLGLFFVTFIGVIIGLIVKETIDYSILKPITSGLFLFFGIFILYSVYKKQLQTNDEIQLCPVSLNKCSVKFEERLESCSDIYSCNIFVDNVLSKNAFFKSFALIFFAELGDKTMITAIFLTTSPNYEFFGILIGATIALICVNGLGIVFGYKLAKSSIKQYLEPISGGVFILISFLLFLS
jgi:putative Ca2+/H+ antiporter (TMEM165/GDT1 family)